MLPRLSILALTLTALGAAAPRSAEAPRPGEYEVKAALLFNVLKFVEWPAPPPGALVVCVFKEERMAEALESLGDKIVAGARLQVRRVESAEDTRACRALFIGRSEESRLGDILKATAGLDLLTVADTQGFGERGVVVNFFVEDGHVRFEVNLVAARQSHLQVSAKLLRLARVLKGDERRSGAAP
jgi:hypothetical protein